MYMFLHMLHNENMSLKIVNNKEPCVLLVYGVTNRTTAERSRMIFVKT